MARTVTVQMMIDSVRSLADLKTDDNITDPDIIQWINDGYGELYDMLVSSGLAYFEADQTITTTANQNSYALNNDYLGFLALNYQFNSETKLRLRELLPREIYRISTSGSRAFFYRIAGGNVVLYPTPPAGQVYTLKYVPAAAQLTGAGQTIDGVSGWENYIVVLAAIMGKDKQDRPTDVLRERLNLLRERIMDAAQNRAIGNATSLYDDRETLEYEIDAANWRTYY